MKTVMKQAFGARAYEEYGAVENCVFASECEHGRLHVSPDFGILEIVDEEGLPVCAGREGRLVCTGLLNEAQPLIRYDIGDLGSWAEHPCACARNHLPVLRELIGRVEEVITGPDGRQLMRFHWLAADLPTIIESQVVQEAPDRFRVNVVAADNFGEADQAIIRRRFAARLGPVLVDIVRVPAIERTARGKFKAVITRTPTHAGREVLPN
jgi:phenylacetate-CoA ligase